MNFSLFSLHSVGRFMWRWVARPLLYLVIMVVCVWAVLAIYLAKSPGLIIRIGAAGLFVFGNLAVFLSVRRRWIALPVFLGTFLLVLVWWSLIPASNDRNWLPAMAVLSNATFSNDLVTVHNIRNFDYRSADDFTVQYYDKTFNLDDLEKLYFVISYWGDLQAVAHTFFSFEFSDGECLAISIEARREKGETYSAFKGLFKEYEIMYVVGDERDLIRLRTNYTGERVYLYPTTISPEKARELLVNMLNEVNELNIEPEFYNTITRNCTGSLIDHLDAIYADKTPFYLGHLLNGYTDRRAYLHGNIDTDLPFEEARKAHYISGIAKEYDDDPDFSRRIRDHLPRRPRKQSLWRQPSSSHLSRRISQITDRILFSLSDVNCLHAEVKSQTPGDATPAGGAVKPTVETGESLNVKWNADCTALTFTFRGKDVKYPQDMTKGAFPPAGAQPEFHFEKKWPVVTMSARWTVSVKDWPPKHRPHALDLILMFACDAEIYEYVFPETVRSSSFTFPPEYIKEAKNPLRYNLAESMRGKQLNYEITMKAGFGAADFKIKTKIYVGLSKDGKTAFYYDRPEYISKHLTVREFIFAAHDTGDSIHFEAKLLCVCSPARLLKGERMSRVERDGKYFVQRIYEQLDNAPTAKEIEDYLNSVKQRSVPKGG